jgi:hypothetical protein
MVVGGKRRELRLFRFWDVDLQRYVPFWLVEPPAFLPPSRENVVSFSFYACSFSHSQHTATYCFYGSTNQLFCIQGTQSARLKTGLMPCPLPTRAAICNGFFSLSVYLKCSPSRERTASCELVCLLARHVRLIPRSFAPMSEPGSLATAISPRKHLAISALAESILKLGGEKVVYFSDPKHVDLANCH